MAANKEINYFQFKVAGESETWSIPVTVVEGSTSINMSATWDKVNVQGSTEAMSAFNYVDNPTIPINLKIHEDLWREYNLKHTYLETISKFASLIYPGDNYGTLSAPYVYIFFDGYGFRGYFSSLKVTPTGPLRDGYRVACDISGSFIVVKSTAPTKSGIANSLMQHFRN